MPFRTRLLPAFGLLLAFTAPAAAQTIDPTWTHADTAAKQVTFDLIAGHTPLNGSLNFNGFRDGELTFVAPQGWTVTFQFRNNDRGLTHSAEVITDRQPLPIQSVAPAFPGAGTPDLETGLSPETGGQHMTFRAATAGEYLVFCAVPGHGMAGMWVRLRVDAAAKTAAIIATPKPAAH